MKIAFWSIANDRCNVSHNLAAISIASVTRYPYSVVVLENTLTHFNLGQAYQGSNSLSRFHEIGSSYYEGGGIEALIRKIYRGGIQSFDFRKYLREIIEKRLYYIPQSRVIHSEMFDYEFNASLNTLLSLSEENSDICFIDTASSKSLSTKTILHESDLIVVNLCQDTTILEEFFLSFSALRSKSVFLISNYDPNLKWKYKKIAREYQIPMQDIITIPLNNTYELSYANGCVVEFILRYYECKKDTPNYPFIYAIKKATSSIIRKAANLEKQKELLKANLAK